jgi:starvation-inducible DNA-binding protein
MFRLLQAHELIIAETREAAKAADEAGDDGTNDLLVSEVLRVNELQVWFISAHVEDNGSTSKDEEGAGSLVGAHR